MDKQTQIDFERDDASLDMKSLKSEGERVLLVLLSMCKLHVFCDCSMCLNVLRIILII